MKSEERKREKEKAPAVQTPTVDSAPSSVITPVEQPPIVAESTKTHGESHVETNGVEQPEKEAEKAGEREGLETAINKRQEVRKPLIKKNLGLMSYRPQSIMTKKLLMIMNLMGPLKSLQRAEE